MIYILYWDFFLLILLGAIILIVTVQSFLKNNRVALLLGMLIVGIVLINETLKSELFKSKKILEASLIDDISSIHLILRESKRFEIISKYYFGPDEIFKGKYEIQGEKIIFKDKPYNNEFIPDTIFIYQDKIYLTRNKKDEPDFEFANYFQIMVNLTDNTTQH